MDRPWTDEDTRVLLLIILNIVGFITWIIYYSFFHDQIRYFMFNIIKVSMYPRAITMFVMFAIISSPISTLIYFVMKFVQERKN